MSLPRDPVTPESAGTDALSSITAPPVGDSATPDDKSREERAFTESQKERSTPTQFLQQMTSRQLADLSEQRDRFRIELKDVCARPDVASERARTLEVALTSQVAVLEAELRHARSYSELSAVANLLGGVLMALVAFIDPSHGWREGATIASGVVLMTVAVILSVREWFSRPKRHAAA